MGFKDTTRGMEGDSINIPRYILKLLSDIEIVISLAKGVGSLTIQHRETLNTKLKAINSAVRTFLGQEKKLNKVEKDDFNKLLKNVSTLIARIQVAKKVEDIIPHIQALALEVRDLLD